MHSSTGSFTQLKPSISCGALSGLTCVALAKELHSHHSKDEDDDTEDKGEVAQRPDGLPHDGDEEVQGGPRLGQLEYSQLMTECIPYIVDVGKHVSLLYDLSDAFSRGNSARFFTLGRINLPLYGTARNGDGFQF